MILVQLAFGGGTMQKDIDWEEMALLPKEKGDYWGIGIAEVLWKVCAVVVNCCLKRSAVLHDALHWFIEGKGTGTATLEAKLSQHLVGLAHKPLFQFFLDFFKAYDSLDRGRCLEILRRYGLSPNLARLLKNYLNK